MGNVTIQKGKIYLSKSKSKFTFLNLQRGIQGFHRKYVLVPADMAADSAVVV